MPASKVFGLCCSYRSRNGWFFELMTESRNVLLSRLKSGIGAQGFAQLVQLFIRIAEVPLFLGFWGATAYGEWLMVSAIPSYLAIADGGFAGVSGRDMMMRVAANNRAGALAVFRSTWVLFLVVSVAILVISVPAVWLLPISQWFRFEFIGADELRIVLLLLVVHVLLGFQTGLLDRSFWCEGRYALGMSLEAVLRLTEFVGMATAIMLGGGPVAAASGYLGGRLVGLILMRIALYRATPWLRYGLRGAAWSEIRRLAAPAFASIAFPLGNALNIQGMRIVTGLLLGPAAVAVFASIRTLTRFAMQPAEIVSRLVEPELARAYGSGNSALLNTLFRRSCQVAWWFGLVGVLLVGAGGEYILKIWTHSRIAMDWLLYGLLLAAVLVNAIWNTALKVPYATNRHGRLALWYAAIYGGGALAGAWIGGQFFGIAGVGSALLAAELGMCVLVLSTALPMVAESWSGWFRAVATPPFFLIRTIRAHGLKPRL